MRISEPDTGLIPGLRGLWKLVFGDEDAFLDLYFRAAFRPERCLCATEGTGVTGALYWLPCGDLAYIYAVATHPDHRGKGICRSLMEEAHRRIRAQGYAGAILYPQEAGLRAMYRKLGYCHETAVRELRCAPGGEAVALEQISGEAYFEARKALLPPRSVAQGSPFPELTESLRFYRGAGSLLAAVPDGEKLVAPEYLGPEEMAPGILAALGCREGIFRCPGDGLPFAMVCPLREGALLPHYFAFPLD